MKPKRIWIWEIIRVVVLLTFFTMAMWIVFKSCCKAQEIPCPANLWQGIIAEDTSGNYQDYLIIASVCKNRLENGLNLGLVALKRHR